MGCCNSRDKSQDENDLFVKVNGDKFDNADQDPYSDGISTILEEEEPPINKTLEDEGQQSCYSNKKSDLCFLCKENPNSIKYQKVCIN